MNNQTIDAALLANMFLAGTAALEAKKELVNELNVFPVPDGDTGTNMCMTIESAAREISALEKPVMHELCKAISSGSLRGARGNSGVILSQLFRGFTKSIDGAIELDKYDFAMALQKGCETAYKAVMKPKEGTILTVARAAADRASELAEDETVDMDAFLEGILAEAESTLEITPDLLPVLKEAGVVDSGGRGLCEIYRGFLCAYRGEDIKYEAEAGSSAGFAKITKETEEAIKFGYCTEFIIVLNDPVSAEEANKLRDYLSTLGDSIVMVADDEIIKIHVHTNDPGIVLQKALTYGSLSRIKIDNMREEHQEKLFKDAEKLAKAQLESAKEQEAEKEEPAEMKETGFICVSVGEGINNILLESGCDYVIEGGQTMNPSTEDMLEAISKVNAKDIFIFPNNKNIILAANQAAELEHPGKNVYVVPTTSIPQGITALSTFVIGQPADENLESMKEVIGTVKTGQVTYAIRDTKVNDIEVKKDDFIGIGDGDMLSAGQDREQVLEDTVKAMVDDESALISIYYGEGVDWDSAKAVRDRIADQYPACEVELQNGGQPVYYYIASVE